jgi:DNA repair protein SbcD/Mre11
MKFVHTADWHLGKIIHGRSLIEDQRHVLFQMFERLHQEGIKLCIVAGDIYDRSIPSVEAIKVLNEVLEKAIFDYQIQVILISGNHDSGDRLHFGSSLMNEQLIRIEGVLKPTMAKIEMEDEYGKVVFHCLPYFKPAQIQVMFELEETLSFDEAMKVYLSFQNYEPNARHILITHQFLVGLTQSIESDSELPLSVGGSYHISYEHVSFFNYVALGHLHAPQRVGADHIRYSGSILKYSENEVTQHKGFTIVELSKDNVGTQHIPLIPLRDLRIIQGSMSELLSMSSSEDYVMVYCTDESEITDAMIHIKEVFPNALKFRYTKDTQPLLNTQSSLTQSTLQLSELEVFEQFFKDMKDMSLNESQRKILNELFEVAREMNDETNPT